MSGGFTQPDGGGFHFPGHGPGNGSVSGAGEWRTALNLNDYGADPLGVTDSFDALEAVVAAARAQWVSTGKTPPIFAPDQYLVELYQGRGTTGGRILVDFPGFVLFGDGEHQSRIDVRAPAAPISRRLSMISETTPRGVVATVLGNGVTLTLLADANFFQLGDIVYFSPNADGSSPRAQDTSYGINMTVVSTPGTTIALTPFAQLTTGTGTPPIPGDYIFCKHKMYLQNPGDSALFEALGGFRVSSSATAVDDADFRTTGNGQPIKILSIDTNNNALNISLDFSAVTGFADGDYIYYCPASSLFVHEFTEDAIDEAFDVHIHDIAFTGQFWGFDDRYSTVPLDVMTRLFYSSSNLSGAMSGEMQPARVLFERVRASSFMSTYGLEDGAFFENPHITWQFDDCHTYDCSNCVSMFTDSVDRPDITFVANRSSFYGVDGTHVFYIHSNISLQIDSCRFWDVAAGKEVIDHFGQNYTPRIVTVTNNWFGPGITGRCYLTAQHGNWEFYGNTVESGQLGFRGGQGSIIANTFRPDEDLTNPTCIASYLGSYDNQSLLVAGNHFDFGRVPSGVTNGGTCLFIQYDGRYTFRDNDITANQGAGSNNTPLVSSSIHTGVSLVANGTDVTDLTKIDMVDNRMNFDQTAGQHYLASLGYLANVSIRDNKFTGRGGVEQGTIHITGTAGSGRIEVDHNRINTTGPHGVYMTGILAGTPTMALTRNRVVSAQSCLRLGYTGSIDTEVTDNNLNCSTAGLVTALFIDSTIGAGTVWGTGNVLNDDMASAGLAQRLLPRRGEQYAAVTAGTLTALSTDYDRFILSASAPITVDGFLIGGNEAGQLAYACGSEIVGEFADGNITLGAGGALTVWVASTVYTAGQLRTNAGNVYLCTTGGTSAGSGGPTTTVAAITDGTVTWRYIGAGTSFGNITATGGARAAGSVIRLRYSRTLSKWVEI